ncbi:MAG: hypothetical protein QY321_00150 [Patescibacteria group bacterium]|nr:MAG: hypothetical protein QY321_00150 [Patescibacteria group bacterium]
MYFVIAATSYLLNAGVYVADKFLLSKKIHSSVVYAFYVGIWSVGNFVLLFFEPFIPTWSQLWFDLSAGFLFLFTLIFWYRALHQSEATRVVPIVGALTPIFAFIFSFIFLGDVLRLEEGIAFIVLIAGGLLISVKRTRLYVLNEASEKIKDIFGRVLGKVRADLNPTKRLLFNSFISAFLFAAYYVLIKYIYSDTGQPFIGAFVWSRLGSFLGVMAILLVPAWRRLIKEANSSKKRTPKELVFFLAVRLTAAVAFIMLNWAVSLADNVSLVNALQGVQYAFLLGIVIVLSRKYPNILSEENNRGVMIQKFIGVVLVSLGLYLLIL